MFGQKHIAALEIQLQEQINHRDGFAVQITHDHLGRFYLDINSFWARQFSTCGGW